MWRLQPQFLAGQSAGRISFLFSPLVFVFLGVIVDHCVLFPQFNLVLVSACFYSVSLSPIFPPTTPLYDDFGFFFIDVRLLSNYCGENILV